MKREKDIVDISINQSISFILTPHFSNNMNQGCLQAIGKILNMLIK